MRICRIRAFMRGSPSVSEYPEQVDGGDHCLRPQNRIHHMHCRAGGAGEKLTWLAEQRQEQTRQVRLQHMPRGVRQDGDLGHRLHGLDQAFGTEQSFEPRPGADPREVQLQCMCVQQEAGLHEHSRHAGDHGRQHEWG
jgi:hypothetical protein